MYILYLYRRVRGKTSPEKRSPKKGPLEKNLEFLDKKFSGKNSPEKRSPGKNPPGKNPHEKRSPGKKVFKNTVAGKEKPDRAFFVAWKIYRRKLRKLSSHFRS